MYVYIILREMPSVTHESPQREEQREAAPHDGCCLMCLGWRLVLCKGGGVALRDEPCVEVMDVDARNNQVMWRQFPFISFCAIDENNILKVLFIRGHHHTHLINTLL